MLLSVCDRECSRRASEAEEWRYRTTWHRATSWTTKEDCCHWVKTSRSRASAFRFARSLYPCQGVIISSMHQSGAQRHESTPSIVNDWQQVQENCPRCGYSNQLYMWLLSLCLSICPHFKRKMVWAVDIISDIISRYLVGTHWPSDQTR